jgi:hypothetical protein
MVEFIAEKYGLIAINLRLVSRLHTLLKPEFGYVFLVLEGLLLRAIKQAHDLPRRSLLKRVSVDVTRIA